MRTLLDREKSLGYQLLYETVGIQIEIISNHYEELPGFEGAVNTYQEIVFQIKEEVINVHSIRLRDKHVDQLTYFHDPYHRASDWGGLSVFGDKITFSGNTYNRDIWAIEYLK